MLVDIHQAADVLGVSERTVQRWVEAEAIAYRPVGRTLHFRLASLKPPPGVH